MKADQYNGKISKNSATVDITKDKRHSISDESKINISIPHFPKTSGHYGKVG